MTGRTICSVDCFSSVDLCPVQFLHPSRNCKPNRCAPSHDYADASTAMLHFHVRLAARETEREAAAAASLSQFCFRTGLFVEQRERPQGNAGRQVVEVGIPATL